MANAVEPVTAGGGFAVTKSNSTVFGRRVVCLYVGGTGDVTVRFRATQETVTFSTVPAGTLLPLDVDQVRETGTSATTITAMCY
jgi:hypothetical protein